MENIQTIQLTSKRWKKLKVIGVALWLTGMMSCTANGLSSDKLGGNLIIAFFALIMICSGFIVCLYASFMSWYHHG